MIRRRSSLALLAVLLQMTTGCSFAFMSKAQEPVAVPNYPVDCTSSRAAPVLDVICSGYFVVNAVTLAGMKTCDSAAPGEACIESGTRTGGMILSAGLAALCGVAAGSGFAYASRCDQVKDLNALCITGDEPSCKRLNPAFVSTVKITGTPAATAPAANSGGCSRDTDCKGERICVQGSCAEPAAKALPAQ